MTRWLFGLAVLLVGCPEGQTTGGAGGAGGGGGGGAGGSGPSEEELALQREACAFHAGALPHETLGNLPAELPIEHLIVLMQENRSFDHYLGHHPLALSGEMDGIPAAYTNPDDAAVPQAPGHATTTCIAADPPHTWSSMHDAWNGGANDRFYLVAETAAAGTGPNAISYYEPTDLPFYTWLYGSFATTDRFFCACLGPTAPNRKYLMTGTSNGLQNGGDPLVGPERSIFEALDEAGVSYRMYNPEMYDVPTAPPSAVRDLPAFFADLASGDLPTIVFVNAEFESSEHPPLDVHLGEQAIREVVLAFAASPAWSSSAFVLTYDESGGFFDHVPPPPACTPDDLPENAEFDRLGFRVPFVIVSAWGKPAFVSHKTHSTTSITRLVEAIAGIGALTSRDANSDALLDLFDFDSPPRSPPDPSSVPMAGPGTCMTP